MKFELNKNVASYKCCILFVDLLFFLISVFLLADGGKTLTFFNNDFKGEFQTVTFEGPEIKKLFFGNFHKVRITPDLRCLFERCLTCGWLIVWLADRPENNLNFNPEIFTKMMCNMVVVQSAEIIQAKYFISNIKNIVKTSGSWDNDVGVCLWPDRSTFDS